MKKLPVGSVIKIKNKKEKYIIIGRNVFIDKKIKDYLCVVYPYGYTKEIDFVYFDDEEAEFLCFLGNINF